MRVEIIKTDVKAAPGVSSTLQSIESSDEGSRLHLAIEKANNKIALELASLGVPLHRPFTRNICIEFAVAFIGQSISW